MTYKVYFTISNSYCVDIEADSRDEAWETVQNELCEGDDAYESEREWYDGHNDVEEVRLK